MNYITPWHERPEVLKIDEKKDWTPDSQDIVDKAKADEIAELRAALAQPAKPPPECQSEAEKTAYAFGWWKALESVNAQPAKPDYRAMVDEMDMNDRVLAAIDGAQPAKPEPTLKWCEPCGEGVVDFCRARGEVKCAYGFAKAGAQPAKPVLTDAEIKAVDSLISVVAEAVNNGAAHPMIEEAYWEYEAAAAKERT